MKRTNLTKSEAVGIRAAIVRAIDALKVDGVATAREALDNALAIIGTKANKRPRDWASGRPLVTVEFEGQMVTSRDLAKRARERKLKPDEYTGSTFSVSNLGMFGIDQFDAIINPPQGAILAVGAVNRVMAEGPDGQGRFESRLALSLSCDHRAIDGALGAQFMASLREVIEAPEALFAA